VLWKVRLSSFARCEATEDGKKKFARILREKNIFLYFSGVPFMSAPARQRQKSRGSFDGRQRKEFGLTVPFFHLNPLKKGFHAF
jgi:hypothetical protein